MWCWDDKTWDQEGWIAWMHVRLVVRLFGMGSTLVISPHALTMDLCHGIIGSNMADERKDGARRTHRPNAMMVLRRHLILSYLDCLGA